MADRGITRIVLTGCQVGCDDRVAAALMETMGLSNGLSSKIVASAPIALLFRMTSGQAFAVMRELKALLVAGAHLEIQMNTDKSVAHVGWPSTPRINGRVLTDFAEISKTKNDTDIAPAVSPAPAPVPGAEDPLAADEEEDLPDLPEAPSSTDIAPAAFAGGGEGVELADDEEEDPLFDGVQPLHDTASVPIIGDLKQFENTFGADAMEAGSDPQVRTPGEGKAQSNFNPQTDIPPGPPPGPFTVTVPSSSSDEAASIVADALGIDPNEALERLKQPSLIVARNVDRDTAKELSLAFRDAGVKAVVTRPKIRR